MAMATGSGCHRRPMATRSRLLHRPKGKSEFQWAGKNYCPYNGSAWLKDLRSYTSKKLDHYCMYVAIHRRPDIAFAVSRLARFMMNPGPEHQEAAERAAVVTRKGDMECRSKSEMRATKGKGEERDTHCGSPDFRWIRSGVRADWDARARCWRDTGGLGT